LQKSAQFTAFIWVERFSVKNSLNKENEKENPIKNKLGAAKETILPCLQKFLNTEFRIQPTGKAKSPSHKQVRKTTQ
jgi:hypothetical protein